MILLVPLFSYELFNNTSSAPQVGLVVPARWAFWPSQLNNEHTERGIRPQNVFSSNSINITRHADACIIPAKAIRGISSSRSRKWPTRDSVFRRPPSTMYRIEKAKQKTPCRASSHLLEKRYSSLIAIKAMRIRYVYFSVAILLVRSIFLVWFLLAVMAASPGYMWDEKATLQYMIGVAIIVVPAPMGLAMSHLGGEQRLPKSSLSNLR